MSSSSNISFNSPSNALTVTGASSIIVTFPKEILELICRHLNSARDVVQFASTNRKFYFLASDSPLSAPLWNLFLRKDFPDSCADLKPETKSLALYKSLTNVMHNMKAGKCRLQTLNGHQEKISCMAISAGKLISGSWDKTIKIWDLSTGNLLHTLNGHQGAIECITILDGKLISGSSDKTIKIWDLSTGNVLQTLSGHQEAITCMAISDGKLISGSWDNTIKIWDLSTGNLLHTLNGHQDPIECITILDGKLISGSWDKTIKIWDLSTGNVLHTLRGHQEAITCMAISDGKLISGSWDNTIKIWDLSTGNLLHTLSRHEGKISCMAISDGKLISGAEDSTIKIWDLITGEELHTLSWPQGQGGSSCMTVLNGKLISGSWDNTIKIWDLSTGKELQPLRGHQEAITCMTVLNGKLISGSWDHTIKIWDFNFPSLLVHSKQLLEENKNKPAQELFLLLANLGINTEEDFLEKLNCRSRDLAERGISSPEDLQVLFTSHNLQYLQIILEEVTDDRGQLQARAFNKQGIVSTLLDELLAAAEKTSEEAKQCSVVRDDSGNVYDAPNPWIIFQKKLSSIQDDLNTLGLAQKKFLEKFSPESYAELVIKVNALIDEFRTLERKTQFVRLHAYVNQWGILRVWIRLRSQDIHSLSALLQQNNIIKPQDIFNMGE